MSIKTILATAFAMLMMVNISTAMAGEKDKKDSKDTKSVESTVCNCGASATKTDLEKKAEEADKRAKEADKHAKDVENDDSASDEDKKKAKEEADKADKDKEKADKDAKDEEKALESKFGACICPNGSTSYNVPAGAAGAGASTSAFREVRGQ